MGTDKMLDKYAQAKWYVDLETVSLVDLTKVDLLNYANDPSTRILMVGLCKEAPWEPEDTLRCAVLPRAEFVELVTEAASDLFAEFLRDLRGGRAKVDLVAHNANFDMTMMRNCLEEFARGHGLKGDDLHDPWAVHDTSIMARTLGYPGKLDLAAVQLGLRGKDHEGHALMKATTNGIGLDEYNNKKKKEGVVRKLPYTWTSIGPGYYKLGNEVVGRLMEYCIRDVETCRDLFHEVAPRFSEVQSSFEPEVEKAIENTSKCNETGIRIDLDLLDKLIEVSDKLEEKLTHFTETLFGLKGTQKTALLKAMNQHLQIPLNSLNRYDLLRYRRGVPGRTVPNDVQRTIFALLKYSKSSLRKLKNVKAKLRDGKLKDFLVYAGAGATGRWSSWGFQIQNLPRPTHTLEEVKKASVEDMIDDPNLAVSAIRALIIPSPGNKIVSIDLSQIEPRLTLYRAGETKFLKKIYNGEDPYQQFADIAKITRKVAKAAVLSLQYGIGADAFRDIVDQNRLDANKPKYTIEEAKQVVKKYRETYPKVVEAWAKLGKLIKEAHEEKKDLLVPLKSGRFLNFGRIMREYVEDKKGYRRLSYTYDLGKMKREIHGAKLFNNVIQAEARDVFLIKFNTMFAMGHNPLFCVHDEVVMDAPEEAAHVLKEDFDMPFNETMRSRFPGLQVESEMNINDCYYK